jgi:hypothetical protein
MPCGLFFSVSQDGHYIHELHAVGLFSIIGTFPVFFSLFYMGSFPSFSLGGVPPPFFISMNQRGTYHRLPYRETIVGIPKWNGEDQDVA